jgi:hypothetical protein
MYITRPDREVNVEKRYVLELNAKQLDAVLHATELLARMGIGQISHVTPVLPPEAQGSEEISTWLWDLEAVIRRQSLSIGIPAASPLARASFDIYQVLRQAVEDQKGGERKLTSIGEPVFFGDEPPVRVSVQDAR